MMSLSDSTCPNLIFAQVSKFTVSCPVSIGKLLLIELDKQRLLLFPEDSWFPAKVEVKSPEGDVYNFPIYRWITDSKVQPYREGTGLCCLLTTENKNTRLVGESSFFIVLLCIQYVNINRFLLTFVIYVFKPLGSLKTTTILANTVESRS